MLKYRYITIDIKIYIYIHIYVYIITIVKCRSFNFPELLSLSVGICFQKKMNLFDDIFPNLMYTEMKMLYETMRSSNKIKTYMKYHVYLHH